MNATYDPKLHWELPNSTSFNIFTDVPWSYITIGSLAALSIITAASHVARKRPGRVKYSEIPPSSQKSSETITQDKKETREEKKKKSKSSKGERLGQSVLSDSDF